jgi:hypothetical protein
MFNANLFGKTFTITFYLIRIDHFKDKNRIIKVIWRIDINES